MTKTDDIAKYAQLPAWTGANFTKTIHKNTPSPAIDPRKVKLSKPFVACITGGGRGLGEAYAIAYAQAGASNIILAARSVEEMNDVKKQLVDINAEIVVSIVKCDVTSETDVHNLQSAIKKDANGRLDVLVNNAAHLDAAGWKPMTEGDPEDFRRVLDVNIFGVYLVTRMLLPLLLGTEDGAKAVVGITSMSSHFASYSISNAMSKLALNRFTEFLDKEYSNQGLVSYALHPSGVATRMSTSEAVPTPLQSYLTAEPALSAHFLVWLTKEKREWLSGRYVACTWDVDELEAQKEEIVNKDKLKFRMVV